MRRLVPTLALVTLAGCGSAPPPKPAANDAVTLKTVKWPELESAIAAHKGKVVVIDLWAEY